MTDSDRVRHLASVLQRRERLAELLAELAVGQQLILAELRALRARAAEPGPKPLRTADAKALAALLPVVANAVGDREFTTSELFDHAGLEVGPEIPLTTALAAVGNSRRVGRLLARGSDVVVGGLRLCVLGGVREGLLFKVTAEARENPPCQMTAFDRRVVIEA